jgi:hypothetical protein
MFIKKFVNIPDAVEKNAEHFYRRILSENLPDCPVLETAPEKEEYTPDLQRVGIKSPENEDSRTFGCE